MRRSAWRRATPGWQIGESNVGKSSWALGRWQDSGLSQAEFCGRRGDRRLEVPLVVSPSSDVCAGEVRHLSRREEASRGVV
jgi:hypothetical protein